MVYIIKSGEFEINKKFKKEEIREVDMSRLLGPKNKNLTYNESEVDKSEKTDGFKPNTSHVS